MQYPVEENEIELFDYLKIIFQYRYFIVLFAVFCTSATVFMKAYNTPKINESSIGVKLFFEGIQNGFYPNKARFSKNDFINPKFLEETLKTIDVKKYNLDSEVLTLSLRPFVREIIPAFVKEKFEKKKKGKAALEKFEFFPDEFEVYIREPEDLEVPGIVREAVLEGIIHNWLKWFESKFIETDLSAVVIDTFDFSEYEYFNIIDLIQVNVQSALNNLDNISNPLKNYRSFKTGLNANDIKMMLNVFLENDLFRIKSLIDVERVYKDKEMALKYLEYKVKFLKKKRDKADSEYQFVTTMMEKVEKTGSSALPALFALMFNKDIAKVPATGEKSEGRELNTPPDIFESLARQATEAGVKRTNTDEEIKFLQMRIDEIKSTELTASAERIKKYDAKLMTLASKAKSLIEKLNDLQLELKEKQLKDSVKVTSGPESYSLSRGLKKTGAISLIVGLFAAVFLSFFINYIREHLLVKEPGAGS